MTSSRMRQFAQVLACLGLLCVTTTITSAGAGSMLTGGITSQPIGHYEFCRSNPRECGIRLKDTGPLQLTDVLWKQIVSINQAVNKAVQAMSDFDIFGKDEVWTYPRGVGDCEDYALEKRRALMQRGVSLSNLLLTVVRKSDGEGHAVLTVRTDKGDFILDNLNEDVLTWDRTGYRYLKRQSSENTGRWVSIQDGDQTLVGAVSK